MTALQWYPGLEVAKDPDAILDWQFDLSSYLDGDTVLSADVDGGGLTVDNVVTADKSITVWLSGGVDGQSYTVRVRFTTVGGRTDDRSIVMLVQEQ